MIFTSVAIISVINWYHPNPMRMIRDGEPECQRLVVRVESFPPIPSYLRGQTLPQVLKSWLFARPCLPFTATAKSFPNPSSMRSSNKVAESSSFSYKESLSRH